MIISRGRGYVFVHIPKTGGTSLALALESRALKDDILIGDTPKARRRRRRVSALRASGRVWKHSTLADMAGELSDGEMRDLFVFTLVRNPWDRAFSYFSWLQAQRFSHPAVGLAQSLSFEDFVAHPSIQGAFRAQPFASYVTDPGGALRCDLFLRLENLNTDLALLEQRLGLALGPVPHANRSTRALPYQQMYNPTTRRLIADACADDIARFGYEF